MGLGLFRRGRSDLWRLVDGLSSAGGEDDLRDLHVALAHTAEEFSDSQLWAILRRSEKREGSENEAGFAKSLFDVKRCANWELQRRYRAV